MNPWQQQDTPVAMGGEWKKDGTLWVYAGPRWVPGRPLALFAFDGTLRPCRGRGADTALTSTLVRVLVTAAERNVAIFSNRAQQGFGALAALREYVALVEAKGGSCDVYAATGQDRWRKPQQGAWEYFCAQRGVALTPSQRAASFFCGGAAGRAADSSAVDRAFARNAGIRFCVPEQVFGGRNVSKGVAAGTLSDPAPPRAGRWSIEAELTLASSAGRRAAAALTLDRAAGYGMVLMVGSPASGKTLFARRLGGLGFTIASQDIQGTKARCKAHLAAGLSKPGASAVVDNTHRSRAVRAEYIAAGRAARPGLRVAMVWVTTPRLVCLHLDGLRCDSGGEGALLPRPVIPSYWKNFEPPDEAEADALFALDFAWDPSTPPEVFEKRYV